MMARHTAPLISVCLLAGLCACAGGGDDPQGTTGLSGLSGDAKLSALEDTQYAMACESLREVARRALPKQERDRAACTWLVGSEISTRQAAAEECEGLVQRCLDGQAISRAPKPQSTADLLAEMGCETTDFVDLGFARCEATIAEYEACIHASTAWHRLFLASITCDAVSDDHARGLIQRSTTSVPECDHLRERCPSIDR
jgi:hypothetical protein